MADMKCQGRKNGKNCHREAREKAISGRRLCVQCYSRWWKNQRRKTEPRWLAYVERRNRVKEKNRAEKQYKQFIEDKTEELKKFPTAAEVALKDKLDKLQISYEFQWSFYYRGYAGICDFYLPTQNLIIEVDGGYHSKEEQRIKDRIRNQVCADNLGKPILRITNKQVFNISDSELISLIEKVGIKKNVS